MAQAKNYAGKLAVRYTYATNGQGIYAIDMLTGKEGEIAAYPTPDELWVMTFAKADAWRDRFAAISFEDKGGSHPSRYYQDIAIERVMSAIAAHRQRILLTLATGTGKTFIAFQIAWKLFHSRWNLTDWKSSVNRRGDRAFYFWPTGTFWQIRLTTHSQPFPKTHWCGFRRMTSRKRARCRKTAACFSRFSRRL